ncbi:MAG: SufBD protein [Eubacteriaceae bacterium]|jgi:hypothetical protein
MNIEEKLKLLTGKDNSLAFSVLTELEEESEQSPVLYPYLEEFAMMTGSDKYVLRVRGFRLFCKQARWDQENRINQNIDTVLAVLNDKKPTAVRQALGSLPEMIRWKPELSERIRCAVLAIDTEQYKESMQGLIRKDINNLLLELPVPGQTG